MNKLINHLLDKLHDNKYHYKNREITEKVNEYERAFKILAGVKEGKDELELAVNEDSILNMSKEIIEDAILLTYINEKEEVFIGCTTCNNSDVFIKLEKPASKFEIHPGDSINIWDRTKVSEEEYKNGKRSIEFLSHKIYFYKNANGEKEVKVVEGYAFINRHNMYPSDIIEDEDGNFIVCTYDGKIFVCDKSWEIIKDVNKVIHNIIGDIDNDKEYTETKLQSSDLVVVSIHSKNSDFLLDDILRTYVISISKEVDVNKFTGNISINNIVNKKRKDYHNKSYIWLTESLLGKSISSEDLEGIKKGDADIINRIISTQSNKFISGLTPLYLQGEDKINEYTTISGNTNDIGGIIYGLNMMYIVLDNPDDKDKFILRIFDCENEKIVSTDIPVSFVPDEIYAYPSSGVISFKFSLMNKHVHDVVSYFPIVSEIWKFNHIVVNNCKDRDEMYKYIGSEYFSNFLASICGGETELSNDELMGIYNKIDEMNMKEDFKTSELQVKSFINMDTYEPLNYNNIYYGMNPEIYSTEEMGGLQRIYKRVRKNQSINELYEELNKKFIEDEKLMKEWESKDKKDMEKIKGIND